MTGHEYLEHLLRDQMVSDQTIEQMRATRDEIEGVIRSTFGSALRIYYAGSYGKSTMIAAYHDLDIVVYFPSGIALTLKDIYWSVYNALASAGYGIKQKDVAIRLPYQGGFYVDVVPGRALDQTFEYANLYRSETDSRLQTSIKVHIQTISNSGLRGTMRLMKLWNVRHNLGIRSFALELLTIRALQGHGDVGYDEKMMTVLSYLAVNMETVRLVDPANSNNIISDAVSTATKYLVAEQARASLNAPTWEEVVW